MANPKSVDQFTERVQKREAYIFKARAKEEETWVPTWAMPA
jgi:hypothetical protein